jgi:hypothetical protein
MIHLIITGITKSSTSSLNTCAFLRVLCVNLLRPTRQHYHYYLIQGEETKAHDSEEAAPILQPGIDAEGHENSQCLQVLYSEFPCCALVINQLFCTL